MKLRFEFLVKNITEAQYRQALVKREKKLEKHREIRAILTMLRTTMLDILWQAVRHTDDHDKKLECVDMLHKLRDYTNEALDTLRKRYSNKIPRVNEHWRTELV